MAKPGATIGFFRDTATTRVRVRKPVPSTRKSRPLSPGDEIQTLARKFKVTYQPNDFDEVSNAMARLSGDPADLDPIELTLLALERAGHVTAEQADQLHIAYLKAQ